MSERLYWLDTMLTIAHPLLSNLARGTLKETMPCEQHPEAGQRPKCTYLEGLGRTLCGIAPWLEHDAIDAEEQAQQKEYRTLTLSALSSACDPDSADFVFHDHVQAMVDAAFLSQAFLRAPTKIWHALDGAVQKRMLFCIEQTVLRHKPYRNNWLLFAATIEAFRRMAGCEDWDRTRIDYALFQHDQWYVGDSFYKDGPSFHMDYYNSYVIHPMLMDILRVVSQEDGNWKAQLEKETRLAARYAGILERMIAPDGTFPVVGRSICYRSGAFHALAQAALLDNLPVELPPAQARCAMGAMIRRCFASPHTFSDKGFLRIGLVGAQPALGDYYISTGSLYLCMSAFLPLGLPETHAFWQDADAPWTSVRCWVNEEDIAGDHSV